MTDGNATRGTASASSRIKRDCAYAEAVERLVVLGQQILERGGKRFSRFNEAEFMYGRTLMWTYFYKSHAPKGDERVEGYVRFGFVLACLKQNLTGLPGQRYTWYGKYLPRVSKYLESLKQTSDQP